MLSDVIERYGGKKIDPLDVYKDIFRIGEGFIQKEYEKGALILMDGIVAFIVGTLIGIAIHSYTKKRKEKE